MEGDLFVTAKYQYWFCSIILFFCVLSVIVLIFLDMGMMVETFGSWYGLSVLGGEGSYSESKMGIERLLYNVRYY